MFIVTGGAGFIGSNIVKSLNERGITDILVVDDLEEQREIADKILSELGIRVKLCEAAGPGTHPGPVGCPNFFVDKAAVLLSRFSANT